MTAREEIDAHIKILIDKYFDQLEPSQKIKFNKIYPVGVPYSKLEHAIVLIQKTIENNKKKVITE